MRRLRNLEVAAVHARVIGAASSSGDTADRRPGSGSGRTGAAAGYGERGSGDFGPSPRVRGRAQPISSRALPFVSLTNFRMNGMESAAKAV